MAFNTVSYKTITFDIFHYIKGSLTLPRPPAPPPFLFPHQLAVKLPYLGDSLCHALLLTSHRDLVLVEGEGRDVDPGPRGISDGSGDSVVGTHDEGVKLLGDLQTLKRKLGLGWGVKDNSLNLGLNFVLVL